MTHADLAHWLLVQEIVGEMDSPGLSDAAERVGQKLSLRLAKTVSAIGAQALVTRALSLARHEFPFFEGVSAGIVPAACFEGLSDRVLDVEASHARAGLLSLLGRLLDLLVGFVGEGLTMRLLREVWPDVPIFELSRYGSSDGQEATS